MSAASIAPPKRAPLNTRIRPEDRNLIGRAAQGRSKPRSIPVVVPPWLAVRQSLQGAGLGRALVRDARLHVLQARPLPSGLAGWSCTRAGVARAAGL